MKKIESIKSNSDQMFKKILKKPGLDSNLVLFIEKISKEPHYDEFKHNDLVCRIIRVDSMGHYCGYVGVPKNHHYYGVHYVEIYDNEIYKGLEVHGGLTFSSTIKDLGDSSSTNEDYWFLGFDCAHAGDFTPSNLLYFSENIYVHYADFKDYKYVKDNIIHLAEQLTNYNYNLVAKLRKDKIMKIL